jgi:hypothetical protein
VQRVKCSASAAVRGQEGELCDALEPLEAAFREAIAKAVDCAPKTGSEGTINYVLTLDFRNKKKNVFPGASGEWKGPQARRAAVCVEKAFRAPNWDNVRHQYNYYMLAILATYPGPQPIPGPPGAPVFE